MSLSTRVYYTEKTLTKVTAVESILGFGTEGLEAHHPSIRLLFDRSIVWVNLPGPRPSGKYIRNEDPSGWTTSVDAFLEKRLWLDRRICDGGVALPGDLGKHDIEGEVKEEACEYTAGK